MRWHAQLQKCRACGSVLPKSSWQHTYVLFSPRLPHPAPPYTQQPEATVLCIAISTLLSLRQLGPSFTSSRQLMTRNPRQTGTQLPGGKRGWGQPAALPCLGGSAGMTWSPAWKGSPRFPPRCSRHRQ